VFYNKGKKKWSGAKGFGMGASCVANLDLEGYPEIIAGNTAYSANGEEYWTNDSVGDGFTAIANFDDDPHPEIVVVTEAKVYLLEHTGNIIWEVSLPGCTGMCLGGSPTIADFDNDGEPEIGVSGLTEYTMFESDGTAVWSIDIKEDFTAVTSSSVFDFEGDGSAEVVYNDID
ncbi:MAG: hemolysin, partial [bacterium]|nr:hemolysin [bacterium]